MKKYYRDFYGCTASIAAARDGKHRLRMCTANGTPICNKVYETERGARVAMGRASDGWREVKEG